MNIRPSSASDIPQIIQLLKISLGESLMPKSEAYWHWKHVINPFGASPVWVAEEDNQLIGVRAFMKWRWQSGSKKYTAIRAVDTASHPAHQGKGIFKKLTLHLLDQCKDEGIDIVYNTPNGQSKPGYLKMGWQEAGKLPIQISINNPVNVLLSKVKKEKEIRFLTINDDMFSITKALSNFNFKFENSTTISTSYSLDYLKWRYTDIPMITYYARYNESACCIFRLKQGSLGKELRICDVFGTVDHLNLLLKDLKSFNLDYDYLSIDGFSDTILPGVLKLKRNLGPDVTIRQLAINELSEFQAFTKWHPSLGDLEVF